MTINIPNSLGLRANRAVQNRARCWDDGIPDRYFHCVNGELAGIDLIIFYEAMLVIFIA